MTQPTWPWSRRLARAATLRNKHPAAAELLGFYEQVLRLQESLYQDALRSDPSAVLDPHAVLPAFQRFITAVEPGAPQALADVSRQLVGSADTAGELLQFFLTGQDLDVMAEGLSCPTPALVFFPRAFVQPWVEAGGSGEQRSSIVRPPPSDTRAGSSSTRAVCPRCGRCPQLALLQDDLETRGQRRLLCALCSHEWEFPRVTCPQCGTTSADHLRYHLSESWPQVRVEECQRCGTYLKAIDLRTDGLAVPLVDELASIELDLWATEAGLAKIELNLLGL